MGFLSFLFIIILLLFIGSGWNPVSEYFREYNQGSVPFEEEDHPTPHVNLRRHQGGRGRL